MGRCDATATFTAAARRSRVRNRGKVNVINHIARNTSGTEYYRDRNTIGALRNCKTANTCICCADRSAAAEYCSHLFTPNNYKFHSDVSSYLHRFHLREQRQDPDTHV